ncbi:hypothetical protein SD80_007120 [Scytonema tolypothrichoides VB-61278]|nr:hypothetical protein SD80_007120 [Scytonema tolypothrichoides VB-61278]
MCSTWGDTPGRTTGGTRQPVATTGRHILQVGRCPPNGVAREPQRQMPLSGNPSFALAPQGAALGKRLAPQDRTGSPPAALDSLMTND